MDKAGLLPLFWFEDKTWLWLFSVGLDMCCTRHSCVGMFSFCTWNSCKAFSDFTTKDSKPSFYSRPACEGLEVLSVAILTLWELHFTHAESTCSENWLHGLALFRPYALYFKLGNSFFPHLQLSVNWSGTAWPFHFWFLWISGFSTRDVSGLTLSPHVTLSSLWLSVKLICHFFVDFLIVPNARS